MARLTKEQQRALESERVWNDAYELAARVRQEEEERRRLEAEAAAAERAANPWGNVVSGTSTYSEPVEEVSPWAAVGQAALGAVSPITRVNANLGDLARDVGASTISIGAGVMDALSPDPNALSSDSSNPFQNALQNATDVFLRTPVGIVDDISSIARRAAPSVPAEAVDAVVDTVFPFASWAEGVSQERQEEANRRIMGGEDLSRGGWLNSTADSLRGAADSLTAGRSAEAQAASQALGQAMDSGVGDTLQFLAGPEGVRAAASTLAGSAPYAGFGFLTGGAGAAAGLAPAASTSLAGVTMFSTVASNAASEAENAVLNLSPEEAAASPVLSEMMSNGMSLEQAKRAAAHSARLNTIANMVPTAPLYGMGAFERIGAGAIHKQQVLQTLRGRAAAATGREAATEFVQEAGERRASNLAEIGAGTRAEEDRFQGVASSGVVGAMASGPLAAGAGYAEASADFAQRGERLRQMANTLDTRQENREQARFEEETMARLAAEEAQRAFVSAPRAPVTDGIDNAGRPTESFEAWAGREGAEQIAADQAAADFIGWNTLESSNAALQNSLREGPRGVNPGPRLDDAAMAAENERWTRDVTNEQLDQAAFEEEAMSRLRDREVAAEQRAAVESEVAALDSKSSAADLKKAQQKHRADRRSHLDQVRKANASLPQEERVQILADAAQAWDAANPAPTAERVAAAVQAAPAPRRRGQRAAAPVAAAVDVAQLEAAGATQEEVEAAQAAPVEQVSSRIEALRNRRAGRADAAPAESTGRTAGDVVRSLAERVAKGNSRVALAQEQLLLNGKLSVVDPDVMNEVAGGPARGYYDGERMYINADVIPEGNEAGSVLNEILAHEADHAARISENKDAKSKVRILLGDTATEKLLDQLYDSNHPTAVAAREMVEQAGVTEAEDVVRFEDELTAYAISQAMADNATAKWAPIRGLVSAARRKWKDFTGSDDLNLDDLAVYAQRTIDALATSDRSIAGDTDGRAQIAFHGTPSTFAPEEGATMGRFRSSRAGTGEGAQMYGAGHYLTQQHGTAETRYRQRLVGDGTRPEWAAAEQMLIAAEGDMERARAETQEAVNSFPSLRPVLEVLNNNTAEGIRQEVEGQRSLDGGEVYYADIPEDDVLAQWGNPVSAQSPDVRTKIGDVIKRVEDEYGYRRTLPDSTPFGTVYNMLSAAIDTRPRAGDTALSEMLAEAGIKGHVYSGRQDGPRNFVIYSDDDVRIVGRDQREAGQDRRSMEQWGEEIQSRPESSRSLRQQWEADARAGRASSVAPTPRTTAPYQPDMNSKWKQAMQKVPAPILNAVTVAGAAGKGMFNMSQDAENARNSVYQTALSYNARLDAAFDKAAKARGVTKQELNSTIMKRLEAIAAIPNVIRKDTLIARVGQEYPELSGLVEAIQDINAQTDAIIDARLADPREISEEELSRLEYMDRNKYSYLTNVYAAFQGKEGKDYKNRMLDHYEKAKAIVDAGGTVPENIKREYDTYAKALRWVVANDVAVSDPEQLAALPIEDVEGLYNMWSPNRDTAQNLRTRMTNEGNFDVNAYRDFMADNISTWVEGADTATIENLGTAVLQNLLNNNPVSGPARRYGRGGGLDDSILQHRKEVPAPLQELYGKVSDIPALINATLTRQGELAERMRFFNRMREETNERGMPYVVTQREAAEQFPEYTVKLSGESYGAVNGMYTTPAIARSIDDYTQESVTLADTVALVANNPSIARKYAGQKWFEVWTKLAGAQKAMKIITRPDYLLLNAAGSIFTPVLTGGVSLTDMNRGRKVVQEHLSHTINPSKDEQISMDLRLALEMGLFDNAVTQEIRRAPRQMVQRMIREMTHADDLNDLSEIGNQLQGAAKRTWNTLVEMYSMSDAWAKIPVGLRRIDYLRAYYDANGEDVSNEQIVREAAAFVRDSTIGMQAVPAGVKLGERLGLTFYAPYFYSAFRALGRAPMNMWNDAKMALDAKTPEARNIAATSAALKAVGISTTAIAMTGAMKQLADSLMDDDEREQADRDRALMFPGEAVGDVIYLGKDDAGRRLYFNLSRIDQWGPATDIYRALQRGDEGAIETVAESMFDLIIMNRAIGPILNALTGKDKNTQLERVMETQAQKAKDIAASVTERIGNPDLGYETMDFLLDMGDLITPAGVMNQLDPNNKSPQEVDTNGRQFISGIMTALGHKFVAVDEKQALGMSARELSNHRRDASARVRDSISANGPQAGLEALLREARRERTLVADLGKKWEAVIGGDTSPRQAAAMLKEANLDARTISNISKKAYMAEADEWAKRYSGILTARSVANVPFSRSVESPEERKAREAEWKEQAKEVRRRLRARSYAEENNDGN